jgi:hypothetical protein
MPACLSRCAQITLQFNLKLDPVYLGVIPGTALPLAAFMAAGVIPAIVIVVCVLLRSRLLSPFLWDPPHSGVNSEEVKTR